MTHNTFSLANTMFIVIYIDTDVLYSKIYERTGKGDSYSALWRYRTRLSLKHLSGSAETKNYKILNNFLEQVFLHKPVASHLYFMWLCMYIGTYLKSDAVFAWNFKIAKAFI